MDGFAEADIIQTCRDLPKSLPPKYGSIAWRVPWLEDFARARSYGGLSSLLNEFIYEFGKVDGKTTVLDHWFLFAPGSPDDAYAMGDYVDSPNTPFYKSPVQEGPNIRSNFIYCIGSKIP